MFLAASFLRRPSTLRHVALTFAASAACATWLGLGCRPVAAPSAPNVEASQASAPVLTVPRAPEPLPSYAFPFRDPNRSAAERAANLVSLLTLEEKIAQMVHDTPAIERLGIPAYSWWNEALHGVARSGRATVFPQAIGLAATFDEALMHEVATVISDEARAKFNAARALGNPGRYAGLTFWSPNINIFRDPRWGRGQETYGEDPFLTARMGVAFVKGLQGDDPKILKSAGCAKHFAVHSGPEALRHEFNVRPSKKDLHETYLPAFEALVREGKVAGVMSAYNRLYGEPASASTFLLQDLLRKQWGFDGYVVSDCWALTDLKDHHKTTRSSAESAAKALKAGVNVDCGSTYPDLKQALAQQLVTETEIDQTLAKLLETRFRLGLFDASTPFDTLDPKIVGSDAHAEVARRAAVESLVLLKNAGNTLPLSKEIKNIALLGPYAADAYVLLGNYFGSSARLSTVLEGIAGKLDAGASMEFAHAFLVDRENPNPIDWTTGAANTSQAVIVTLGLSGLLEGEEGAANASPFKGDRRDIRLPKNQINYVKTLRSKGKAPIIAVVFGGSPLDLAELEPHVDAILLSWYPGQEGGNAIADVLFGDASPSGRLPLTFPRSISDLPSFSDYAMDNRTYRYSTKAPLYPFGFGLSYGQVAYDSLTLSTATLAAGASLTATVTVRNTSTRSLDEVVQLYVSDLQASVRVPQASLIGFRRVKLAPGQSHAVAFDVPSSALQLVNEAGERVLEPGAFRLTAAAAAPGPRALELGSPKPATAEFVVQTAPSEPAPAAPQP
jgi:beta-glucosidase